MKEFEDAYAKNAGGVEQAKKDSISRLKNFLDLYVNFKMKLRDAQVRGFSSNTELSNELLDYKKKVGVSYILEKDIVEPGVKDLYDKRKLELRVSHLMIRPDTSGEEAARTFTQAILDSIKNGKSFEEMVMKYSQDNFSKPVNGDIFYVTAGQLPVEFEDACYKTEVGKIYPQVVQTRYGFHIIKVTEKRERIPQIKASHILIDFVNDKGEMDTVTALAKVDSVLTELKNGTDFAALASKYSDDTGSKEKGGDLGYFERRMMVKEFDEAAFNLKVGEVSNVIKTNFGFHIIKLTDRKPYPTYEEDKENLKKIFKQTSYQAKYDGLIDSLRNKYNYKLNDETFNLVITSSDSVKFGAEHPKLSEFKDKELFSFANKKINGGEFFDRIASNNEFLNKLINKDLLKNAVDKTSSEYLLEEEALNLDKFNSEFASLMDDYKNGIYIFKLQDDEVWSQILLDSTRIYQHYLDTKEKYVWPDRVSYSEIFSRNDSLINHYYKLLSDGENFDSLAAKHTERPGYKEKLGNFGLKDTKADQLSIEADLLKEHGDFSKPIKFSGGFSIVKLNFKEPSRLKTFEEAKPEVSGSFQEAESKRLEQNYIDRLSKKYEPVIYYDKLEEAYKVQ